MAEAITVLLAEGHPILRPVLRRVLEAGGFAVLEAADAAEALAASEAHRGPIGALVCDLDLPPGGGAGLAAKLCRQRPGLRVLLTGNGADKGTGLVARPLLQKPFGSAQLLEALRVLLG